MKNKVFIKMKCHSPLILLAGLLWFQSLALTLDSAVSLALANNLEGKKSLVTKDIARLDVVSTVFSLLPSAKVTFGYDAHSPAVKQMMGNKLENTTSGGFTISQPVFTGGRAFLSLQSSKKRHEMQKISHALAKNTIERETKYLFYSVLEAQERLSIAEKSYDLASQNRKNGEIRFQTGTLSKAALQNLLSQEKFQEVTVIQAKNSVNLSLQQLAFYIQSDVVAQLETIPLDEYRIHIDQLAQLSQSDVTRKIEWARQYALSLGKEITLAKLSEDLAQKSYLMNLGAMLPTIQAQYSQNWNKTNLSDSFERTGQVRIMFSVPILPMGSNVANSAKAKQEIQKSKFSTKVIQENLSSSINQSFLNLVSLAQAIKASELAYEHARIMCHEGQTRFNNALLSVTELQNYYLALDNASYQIISNYYAFLRQEAALLQYIGKENKNNIY